MFFEKYMNLKTICYLRHCGGIPVKVLGIIYAPSRLD
jgi:hypothetical protein